jgi:3-oxoacyl-[acyl-carrier protein] reductase
MLKRKSGCIVNISSVSGVTGRAAQGNYSAAKAGIIGLTKSMARELGRYGIRVNAVAPGFIETDMVSEVAGKIREEAIEDILLGRFGDPSDVADAVSYLVHASYVTGTVLNVDGGMAT